MYISIVLGSKANQGWGNNNTIFWMCIIHDRENFKNNKYTIQVSLHKHNPILKWGTYIVNIQQPSKMNITYYIKIQTKKWREPKKCCEGCPFFKSHSHLLISLP